MTITIKNKDYKFYLTIRDCVKLEKELERNPLDLLFELEEKLMSLQDIVVFAKVMGHMTEDEAFDMLDEYCETKTIYSFLSIIVEVMKDSGLIREVKDQEPADTDEGEVKNA